MFYTWAMTYNVRQYLLIFQITDRPNISGVRACQRELCLRIQMCSSQLSSNDKLTTNLVNLHVWTIIFYFNFRSSFVARDSLNFNRLYTFLKHAKIAVISHKHTAHYLWPTNKRNLEVSIKYSVKQNILHIQIYRVYHHMWSTDETQWSINLLRFN